jgi:hypothetical protein
MARVLKAIGGLHQRRDLVALLSGSIPFCEYLPLTADPRITVYSLFALSGILGIITENRATETALAGWWSDSNCGIRWDLYPPFAAESCGDLAEAALRLAIGTAGEALMTPSGVRQESWQRTGGESPSRGKV